MHCIHAWLIGTNQLVLLLSLCCSVLEPGRSLTLAEKGGGGAELVIGAHGFQVLGTMNPGGDFGKKELSPALSNRFTQVRGE
jgi:midasin (ATPase involved in ribosome maturation)